MKKLFAMRWGFGRSGDVDGLFVATQEEVDSAIGKQVYFGEILGKHSEVYGELKESYLTVVSEDQDKIEWLEGLLGEYISGYNPLEYLPETEEED